MGIMHWVKEKNLTIYFEDLMWINVNEYDMLGHQQTMAHISPIMEGGPFGSCGSLKPDYQICD